MGAGVAPPFADGCDRTAQIRGNRAERAPTEFVQIDALFLSGREGRSTRHSYLLRPYQATTKPIRYQKVSLAGVRFYETLKVRTYKTLHHDRTCTGKPTMTFRTHHAHVGWHSRTAIVPRCLKAHVGWHSRTAIVPRCLKPAPDTPRHSCFPRCRDHRAATQLRSRSASRGLIFCFARWV